MIESLALLSESDRRAWRDSIDDSTAEAIEWDWSWHARPKQMLPGTPGAEIQSEDWLFWLILAGRGFGKTRVGAETVRTWASDPRERILIIGPTESDVRDVMIEGPSGIMSCYPEGQRPIYNSTKHILYFPSGAIGITRSAEKPERLRGPQFTKFWFDELCAARYGKEAWDQVMFGFRLPGRKIKGLITTTPKPIAVLKEIIANPRTVKTSGSSDENRGNLAPEFIQTVIDPYRGTRLGRQEINAELLEDIPGALWTREIIEATRLRLEQVIWNCLVRIVIGVDPAVSHNEKSDMTGIVVAALTNTGHVLVIDELSLKGSPLDWAKVVKAAYHSRGADTVIGEVNNGGDLVERNIQALDDTIAFKAVHASRGKYIRAEPVANLYHQGRVHHIGTFGALEDEMCTWTPLGDEPSPNRMDALVWAVWALVIDPEQADLVVKFVDRYQISSV